MNVHCRSRVRLRKIEIPRQGFPRGVRKTGEQWSTVTRMTPGAKISLAIARKSGWVEDGGISRPSSLGAVKLGVDASRAMALFARYTHNKACFTIAIRRGREGFEVGCVTLQAARSSGPVKIRDAVAIPRAVHPSKFLPIGNRQLKEQIALPERIGLPLLS